MALLPHNEKVFKEIKRAYENERDILVVHGTGLGKSFLFLELMETIFKGKKVLFIVPKHATSTGGIASYDEYKAAGADITFETYNYFKNEERARKAADNYDVLVFDEAHHLGSDLYGMNARCALSYMRDMGKYVLGLTATNIREDKTDVKEYFSDCIPGYSIFEAIEDGLVPSFEYLVCRDNAKEKAGYDNDVKDYRKRVELEESLPLLKEVISNNEKNRWLCFFPSIKSLNENMETVRDAFQEEYKMLCITSQHDTKVMEIDEHEKTVVLCVDKLLEGVHIPKTNGIILFRNIRSLPTFQQVLGRVVHVGEKEHPLIVDCTETAVRMLAKLLKAEMKKGGGTSPSEAKKPLLYCSLQNAEHFNIARLIALMDDRWDDEEVEILRKYYPTSSMKEMLKLLPKRTRSSIIAAAARYNIKKESFFTEEEDEVIRQEYGKTKTKDLAVKLGRTEGSVRCRARMLGLKTRKAAIVWSREDIDLLRKKAPTCGVDELARLFPDRDKLAVKTKCQKLGIQYKTTYLFWTKEEDEIIKKNADKMKWKELAELLPGRKWESVKARANTLGFTHNKAWSKEDDEWLRSVYNTMDIDEIAKRVGRDKQAVLVHARSIGLYKGARRNIWDDDKINFLISNYEIMDRNEIAGKLGIDPHQVTNKAAKLGLKKRSA